MGKTPMGRKPHGIRRVRNRGHTIRRILCVYGQQVVMYATNQIIIAYAQQKKNNNITLRIVDQIN